MRREIDSEELKQLQMGILDKVHSFCEENSIFYSLTYGTLIGAIRHKGYIPWDDDIDICMPRPDYDRFMRLFHDDEGRYQAKCYEIDSSYTLPYGKVLDSNTVLIEDTDLKTESSVNIDVFPIDGVKLNERSLKFQILLNTLLSFKVVSINHERNLWKNVVLFIGKAIMKPVSIGFIIKQMVMNSKRYDYQKSDYVAGVSFGSKLNHPVPKKLFERTILVPFEDRKYNVMNGYDEYLRSVFGDYMQLPPENERVTHHAFTAWRKDN